VCVWQAVQAVDGDQWLAAQSQQKKLAKQAEKVEYVHSFYERFTKRENVCVLVCHWGGVSARSPASDLRHSRCCFVRCSCFRMWAAVAASRGCQAVWATAAQGRSLKP